MTLSGQISLIQKQKSQYEFEINEVLKEEPNFHKKVLLKKKQTLFRSFANDFSN